MKYWPVYVTTLGIWLTGSIWVACHYFVTQQTAFGPTHHPLEHWSLVAHGAFAFAGLWLMGFLWGIHVTRRWRLKRHRKSGGALFAVMLVLIASGYLLYYVSGDDSRDAISLAHWVIGLAMPAFLLVHWSIRAR
jgi:hypothetical protein